MRGMKIRLQLGNLLELVAAGLAVYGVDSLAGWRWCVVAGAVLAAVFAEFLYDDTSIGIPLPFTKKQDNPNHLPDIDRPFE